MRLQRIITSTFKTVNCDCYELRRSVSTLRLYNLHFLEDAPLSAFYRRFLVIQGRENFYDASFYPFSNPKCLKLDLTQTKTSSFTPKRERKKVKLFLLKLHSNVFYKTYVVFHHYRLLKCCEAVFRLEWKNKSYWRVTDETRWKSAPRLDSTLLHCRRKENKPNQSWWEHEVMIYSLLNLVVLFILSSLLTVCILEWCTVTDEEDMNVIRSAVSIVFLCFCHRNNHLNYNKNNHTKRNKTSYNPGFKW